MTKPLILLFGHENSPEGQLSDIAISRCAIALALLKTHPESVVMPTGAFGKNFNVTDRAHSAYLTDYLLANGITADRILRGTNRSNTLENILSARKVIADSEFSRVIAVTSEYHAPRVRVILDRIFRSIRFSIEEAQTPVALIDGERRKEAKSFRRLRWEWVSPPIYEKGAAFPEAVYEASSRDQKHYDPGSLLSVSGLVIVSDALFRSAMIITWPSLQSAVYLFSVTLNIVFFVIYERCAATARTARRSMRLTEIAFDSLGFSSSYEPRLLFKCLPSIQTMVRCLFSAALIIQIILAEPLLFGIIRDFYTDPLKVCKICGQALFWLLAISCG